MSPKDEIHPLFNPVILKKILSHLHIQSLKNCRMTCNLWRKESLKFLMKVSWVKLIRGGRAEHDQYSFRNFMDLIYKLHSEEQLIPFENFYLDHWAINFDREKSLRAFWEICGPTMKQVHFANVIFYEVDTIRNILYYAAPKLESITLEECLYYKITNENQFAERAGGSVPAEDFDEPNLSYDYYDHVTVAQLRNIPRKAGITNVNHHLKRFSYEEIDNEEFPLDWEEIFYAFPNLHKYSLSLKTATNEITKILDALTHVREESGQLGSIQDLSFYMSQKPNAQLNLRSNHLFQIANVVCLPLSSLSLVVTGIVTRESIENIVRQYSPVLKNLCLHIHEDSANRNRPFELFRFQKFSRLLKLCICKTTFGGNNFSFLRTMPQLEELYIWSKEEDFCWDIPVDDLICMCKAMKNFTLPGMRQLSIGYPVENPQSASFLCSWFRNLRVLMMPLTDATIRVIFSELKSLEEITVFERHLTDAGITGNPTLLSDNVAWNSETAREFPFIGDLKKLWKFTLTFRRYEGITDMSIYQGLMEVAELSCILLTRTKISDRALQDLSMKPTMISMVTPTVFKGIDSDYSC